MTTTAQQSEKATLKFSSTLEGRQVELLKIALAKAVEAGGWVAVDLSSVEALSAEAIDTLRRASETLERIGGRLLIINPTAPVPRALDFRSVWKCLQHPRSTCGKNAIRIPVEVGSGSW